MTRFGWMIGFLALAGCAEGEGRAASEGAERVSTFTKLDDKACGRENVIEETGDWDRRCKGAGGEEFEYASGDLREELLLIRGGKSVNLEIPVKVAGGAFDSLGPTLEWRGPKGGAPDVLITRVHVVTTAEGKSDSGRLAIVRLGDSPCIVAVVPPAAGQSDRARAIADGKLPDCLAAAD
jgi:hypothetical protein